MTSGLPVTRAQSQGLRISGHDCESGKIGYRSDRCESSISGPVSAAPYSRAAPDPEISGPNAGDLPAGL
jgi:hypothetical protein